MLHLAKVLSLAALFWTGSGDETCRDETSLVQKKMIVKHRAAPSASEGAAPAESKAKAQAKAEEAEEVKSINKEMDNLISDEKDYPITQNGQMVSGQYGPGQYGQGGQANMDQGFLDQGSEEYDQQVYNGGQYGATGNQYGDQDGANNKEANGGLYEATRDFEQLQNNLDTEQHSGYGAQDFSSNTGAYDAQDAYDAFVADGGAGGMKGPTTLSNAVQTANSPGYGSGGDQQGVEMLSKGDDVVNAAFNSNAKRARGAILGKVGQKMAFTDKVYQQRRAIKMAAAQSVMADNMKTAATVYANNVGIAQTAANRMATTAKAIRRVNRAKEDAIARGIKQRQTQKAAMIGRLQGAKEGAQAAAFADMQMKSKWMIDNAKRAYKAEKAGMAAARNMRRSVVDKDTAVHAAQMGVMAAKNRVEARALRASAKRNADLMAEAIEGPEGIDNKMTMRDANRIAKQYRQMAGGESKIIKDLESGDDKKLADAESRLAAAESGWSAGGW